MSDYAQIAAQVADLVERKNAAYGDSFRRCGEVLKILYPDGVSPDQYGDMLAVVRILDKLARIANNPDAFGESPYRDIAGYGLLGLARDLSESTPVERPSVDPPAVEENTEMQSVDPFSPVDEQEDGRVF